MKRLGCSWLVMMGLAHAAAAQAPGQVEPASAPFLEKRVPEELALEGVVLSRNNLGLQLEQVGEHWLVSLIDLTTERVAASTKLDALPLDREAAVAAMTHVVAELATQIVGRVESLAPASPSPPAPPAVDAGHDARAMLELEFRRAALRFDRTYDLLAGDQSHIQIKRRWVPYQGAVDQAIDRAAFYVAVGRPDLADNLKMRHRLMIGGFVLAGVGYAASFLSLFYALDDSDACMIGEDGSDRCNKSVLVVPLVAAGLGTVSLLVGIHYAFSPHPIGPAEAKSLAEQYNLGLRRRMGLPVSAAKPLLRDVKLAPYAREGGGGLALAARF